MSVEGTDLGVSLPPKPPSLGHCPQKGGQGPASTCLGLWGWFSVFFFQLEKLCTDSGSVLCVHLCLQNTCRRHS